MRVSYTLSELAKTAGIHVETIRYYHRRGLLAEPYQPMGGSTRRYEEAHARRLRFIGRAQALGFGLDEIAALLALEHGQDNRGAKHIAARKLAIVRKCIARLRRIERSLSALAEKNHGSRDKVRCPLM